jgi:hypothetical protein
MTDEVHSTDDTQSVEMPQPSAAPLVLALSIALVAAGVATTVEFLVVGGVLFIWGLGLWISQLLPGRGHAREPFVEPSLRPRPVSADPHDVEKLRRGMPGYRLRLPTKIHPVSAGVKGGLFGGLVMPVPALIYGELGGHGIWWPVNLLAGMVLPGVDQMSVNELEQFQPGLLVAGVAIHIVVSIIAGLMYGVLMPTLPYIQRPLAWGALLAPLLWTAVSYIGLGIVNPGVREGIEWPWFVLSQFIFGVVTALVFMRFERRGSIVAGLLGGAAGGLLMPIPAVLWSLSAEHGIWYPINLLSAVAKPLTGESLSVELERFHADWFVVAAVFHVILSLGFGLAFALLLRRLPAIPAPIAWGGMLMPLLWTAMSYGVMGVVNPALQERVDWPWFVVSQFVFGIVAAIVVVRSEQIPVPPAGRGPDQFADTPPRRSAGMQR